MSDYLMHEGRAHDENPPGRGSGRLPWGSGENPYQHLENGSLNTYVGHLRGKGLSDGDIAKDMGVTVDGLHKLMDIEKKPDEVSSNVKRTIHTMNVNREKLRQYYYVKQRYYEDGETNKSKIARELHVTEGTVRNYLDDAKEDAVMEINNICDNLKSELKKKKFLDVGEGTEMVLGIKETKLDAALTKLDLEDDLHCVNLYLDQFGTKDNQTTVRVLCPKSVDKKYLYDHLHDIHSVDESKRVDTDGTIKIGAVNPKSVSRDRIKVIYDEDGGSAKDGVIELRRGVDDISLGRANYAQVRIAVDDKMYMKGMAFYNDETFKKMPKGIDMVYYSNKKRGAPDVGDGGVFKELKKDKDNPFGATVKGLYDEDRSDEDKELKLTQRYYIDKNGNKQLSCINVLSEEGTWSGWSRTLSSQFLSKQSPKLAERQLDIAYKKSLSDFDDIMKITEPTIKKKMLEDFAEDCDSSACDLKAHALPNQTNSVILPVTSLKDNEVYAPNYETGDHVILVRHPHEGVYQIPYLTVNNNNREGKSVINNSPDAIGINAHVAEQLSGADFDGDSVMVIKADNQKFRIKEPIKELIDFNTKTYKLPKAINPKTGKEEYIYKPLEEERKGLMMGIASNLITDMTLAGAEEDELIRATKYSMVIIDSVKHKLDYKQAYKDFDIAGLQKKYRGKINGGAATIISRSKSPITVLERKRFPKVDPETGKNIWEETGRMVPDRRVKKVIDPETGKKVDAINPETGKKIYETVGEKPATQEIKKMMYYDDAYALTSDGKGARYPMEGIYANYANEMKGLANRARKEALAVQSRAYSPSAAETYSREVESLRNKYMISRQNQPRERLATIISNADYKVKVAEDPSIKDDPDKRKKVRVQCLASARAQAGAHSVKMDITDKEWEAIQSGAIRKTELEKMLYKVDDTRLKQLATPKNSNNMLSSSKIAAIKAYKSSNMSNADIADLLGISVSTVNKYSS